MKLLKRAIGTLLAAAALIVVFAPPAFAYLDPGTGSYIFQALIAVSLGAAFAVKLFWNRIKLLFGARKKNAEGK